MLYSYFIIDIEHYDKSFNGQLPENASIAFRITALNSLAADFFLKELSFAEKNYPFCLALKAEELSRLQTNEFELFLNSIIGIAFHHNYIKTDYSRPLLILESDNTHLPNASLPGRVLDAFIKHGYNDVELKIIYPVLAAGTLSQTFDLSRGYNDLYRKYLEVLKKVYSATASFYFILGTYSKLPEVIETISKAEKRFEMEHPQAFALIQNGIQQLNEQKRSLLKIGNLQEQLSSLNSYKLSPDQTTNRYKKQITELLNFYNTEYEILPLWYKRLGHLLKVLMGKRTFKSLFNDNVNKYKS